MKSVVILFIASAGCLIGSLLAAEQPVTRRAVPPSPALPVPDVRAPSAPAVPSVAAAKTIVTEPDPAVVFQRAFWRRPTGDDHILHGERHEWRDGAQGVQQWQWSIALEPGAALRSWLLVENPFGLTPVTKQDEASLGSTLPEWFPSSTVRRTLKQFRTQGSNLTLYLDEANGRLYATDHGAGFTAGKP